MPGQRAVGPSVVHVELTAGEGPAAWPDPARPGRPREVPADTPECHRRLGARFPRRVIFDNCH